MSDAPSWINPNAILTFPIKWIRTYLVETNDAKKQDNGFICLDDFRVHFITTEIDKEFDFLNEFSLEQNYPKLLIIHRLLNI
ncbi:MAG: hypothetical protein MZV64_04210 [Ignavibacteriales bacterium]|nr:hypothetical protein [Ignavibacteriales bacterium]